MREIIKLGLILLLITSISAVVLGLSNEITADEIKKAEESVSEEARMYVLPDGKEFIKEDSKDVEDLLKKDPNILEVYKGIDGEKNLAGYAIKTTTSGYGGEVEVITGISTDGTITGMNVVNHSETPGLGANSTSDDFQMRFDGLPASSEVEVVKNSPEDKNEVEALTGATITSDAVVEGVNMARQLYVDNLK